MGCMFYFRYSSLIAITATAGSCTGRPWMSSLQMPPQSTGSMWYTQQYLIDFHIPVAVSMFSDSLEFCFRYIQSTYVILHSVLTNLASQNRNTRKQ